MAKTNKELYVLIERNRTIGCIAVLVFTAILAYIFKESWTLCALFLVFGVGNNIFEDAVEEALETETEEDK